MSIERKNLETQLDNLVRTIVNKRDNGRCVLCGDNYAVGVSHFIKRNKSAVRWTLINCHLMCQRCHGEWERNENEKYYEFMVYKYSANTVISLNRETRHPEKFTIDDLKIKKLDLQLQMEAFSG